MSVAKKKFFFLAVLLAIFGGGIGLFVGFGSPNLYAKSSTPEFCAGCHVMQSEYESWFHNGGHRRQKCVDCHLPNDNFARHLTWKSIDGMKDVYSFYSGRLPDTIYLSKHGAEIVQENCKRCHAETISRITEERNCWDCHRRLSHRQTGTL